MSEEKFQVTESEQRRLIIDLLIRAITENTIMRDYIKIILGAKDPVASAKMEAAFQDRYELLSRQLREKIFADYGHIDLSGI